MNAACEVEKFELAFLVADRREGADELTQAGAIDVVHIGEIEEKLPVAALQQLLDPVAKDQRAFANGDSAAEVEDHHVVEPPGIDDHAHCWSSPRIFFTIRSLLPPPSRSDRSTSSMKDRMIRIPRPLGFRRLAISVGSAMLSNSKPFP